MTQRNTKIQNYSELYQKYPASLLAHENNLQNKIIQTRQLVKFNGNCTLKRSMSYPCLKEKLKDNLYINNNFHLRSKSFDDINNLPKYNKMSNNETKSEVCIVKISEHCTELFQQGGQSTNKSNSSINMNVNYDQATQIEKNMVKSKENEVSLSIRKNNQSDYINNNSHMGSRRINQQPSIYSSNNSSTMSPSECENHGFADTTGVRIPIVGYEIIEKRARFTVYKLRVENPFTNDCWLVLRRYTDFVRLIHKLKQTFPYNTMHLQLPRKNFFGDNFDTVFLDNRVQGLQIFVNTIMTNEELKNSKIVRDFFCLDEPPSYSESMEECRAIFEAQEEIIAHLKLQINSKNDLINSLQQKLMDEIAVNDRLKKRLNDIV